MMSFQREYAESYDWLVEVFRDWAFTFFSSFLYYQDYDKLDENERSLYRQGWLHLVVWLPPITLNCVNVLP